MRLPSILAVVLLTAGAVFLTACPKHENFPTALDLQPVPTPDSLIVVRVDPQGTDYDFTWYVTDPDGVVDRVRIYLMGEGVVPDQLIAETTDNPFQATFTSAATGIRFAVSVISIEGVEGAQKLSGPAQ